MVEHTPETRSQKLPKTSSSAAFLLEIVEILVLALILFVVIQFAVETVRVLGVSMEPTLGDQDFLIASRLDYRLHHPNRGDVIIMRDPYDPSKDFIKRVIAVPGDTLLITNGQVRINGHLLSEPYLPKTETWTVTNTWPAQSGQTDVIPPGKYFVMGDNRNHSTDSRVFGPVSGSDIEARAWLRIWPLNELGTVDSVSLLH
jgi:signal peptidase I